MKNKKLNLKSIEVKSFVTDLSRETVNTVKGGATLGCSVAHTCNCTGDGPWETAHCSDQICPVTFGTGGICDGLPPTRELDCKKK